MCFSSFTLIYIFPSMVWKVLTIPGCLFYDPHYWGGAADDPFLFTSLPLWCSFQIFFFVKLGVSLPKDHNAYFIVPYFRRR